MERQEIQQEQDLRQLKAKLDRGATEAERGDLLDGETVFAELRELIEERQRAIPGSPRIPDSAY
jgi:predicted transcriptional regulator